MKAGYARVSTGEQEDALQQQVARLEKAGVQIIYSDIKTGRSSDRKEFNKLIGAVKRGDVSEIVITRIDRLARSVMSMSKTIALLEECKVKLTILDAPIQDISNPFSKFSINQMSALAQFESDLLQNRIKHGFNYFREQGKAPGKVPFGYRRLNEKFAPDDRVNEATRKTNWVIASEIIDYILQEKASLRGTCHWIQEEYGIRWSKRGFRSWLHNPVLRGHTAYNTRNNQDHPELWDIRYNTHTPLISDEKHTQLQELLTENRRKWGSNSNSNRGNSLLSGQIFCGCCGGKCYINRRNNNLIICDKRSVYGKNTCSNKYATPLSDIVKFVDIELSKRAVELSNFAFDPSDVPDSPELVELKKSLENLEKLAPNEFINDAIAGLKSRISQMQTKGKTPNFKLIEEWVSVCSDLTFLGLMKEDVKRLLYRRFVRRVVIRNREVIQIELVDIF